MKIVGNLDSDLRWRTYIVIAVELIEDGLGI
jgi:hypothetical protein